MKFSIKDNLLYLDDVQVQYKESPNQSGGISPKYLIQHFTADMRKGQAVEWLTNPESKVSAHLVIEMDGTVVQLVKFNKKAWHAGVSSWNGIEGLNSFSIGIENVNPGTVSKVGDKFFVGKKEIAEIDVVYLQQKNDSKPRYWHTYNEKQLEVIEEVTKALVAHYNLIDVLGHEDIAPGRKNDPGPAFPMDRIKGKITARKESAITTSNINFRAGGGVEFKAFEVIPKGKQVTVLIKGNTWTKVEYENKLGWVSTKYLK